MKFLIDEDFFVCLKFILDEWGFDAEAVVLDRRLRSAEDEVVLAEAVRRGRVLITFNGRDFVRLHEEYRALGMRHAGIIVCKQVGDYGGFHLIVAWMRRLLDTLAPADLSDRIYRLESF